MDDEPIFGKISDLMKINDNALHNLSINRIHLNVKQARECQAKLSPTLPLLTSGSSIVVITLTMWTNISERQTEPDRRSAV
ncbi:Transient receptor potential cation channel subfamily M member [Dirofilaria immitis]